MKELQLREKVYPNSWKQLKNAIKSGKLPHAFLFAGPSYTGKLNMAADFIALVNEMNPDKVKEKILENKIPDATVVYPEGEKKKEIGIGQIKKAVKNISYYSYNLENKALVISDAEKMNNSAGNSLLKILEEPPANTFIFIIASREDRILPTIRSRCQKIHFGLKNKKEIRKYLEKNPRIDLPESLTKRIMDFSRGRYRLAEKLALNPELLEKKSSELDNFREALKGGVIEAFAYIEKKTKEENQIETEIIEEWAYYLHTFLREKMAERQNGAVLRKIFEMEKRLMDVQEKVENSNANQRVLLENYFVQLM